MAPSRGHCCLVRLVTRADVSSFARLYDGTKWVDAKGRVFADECVVLRCTAGAAQDGAVALAPGHKLRLNPVLPQGNVGTPHGTLLDQVARCKLPRRALRELGVECDPEEVSPSFRYSYTTFSPESAAVAVGECRGVEGGVDYFPWLSKPGLDLTLVPSKLLRRRRGHQTPSQSASAPSPASVPAPTPATAPAPAPAPAPPLPAAWTRRTEPRASPDNEQARYEEDEAEWRALRSQDAAPSEAPTARPQPGGAARQGTDGSGGSVRGRGQRRGGRRSWQRWMQGRHARDRVEGLPQAEAAANGAVPVGEDCESDEEEWDRHMALHAEKETTHHFSTRTEERLVRGAA